MLVEIRRSGNKVPITREEAQALIEEIEALEQHEWCKYGHGRPQLVEGEHFNGEVITVGACIRDYGTDYLWSAWSPLNAEEIYEVYG